MKRRGFLRGTPAILAGTAGCSGLLRGSRRIDLVVVNHSASPFTVELALYRSENDDLSRSDARVYSESIDVESERRNERLEVAEVRPYIVRYDLYENGSRLVDQGHFHYYPPEGDDDGMAFDVGSEGVLTRR